MIIAIAIVIAIVTLVAFWLIVSYNRFVRLNALLKEGWSGIDVQLKRRYDLIPNLIETVKGYASHEQSTFDAVVAARAKATSASGVADVAAASQRPREQPGRPSLHSVGGEDFGHHEVPQKNLHQQRHVAHHVDIRDRAPAQQRVAAQLRDAGREAEHAGGDQARPRERQRDREEARH